MMRRDTRRGFTMVELLVASIVSSLVLIVTYSVFIANTNQYYVQEQIVQMQEGMRFALEYLKNDLRNVGRLSVSNGLDDSGAGEKFTDPGYCNIGVDRRGVELFDNESVGTVPAILRGAPNSIRPDRLRLMVDVTGGTPLVSQNLAGDSLVLGAPDEQLSEEARGLLASRQRFESKFKAGYFVRIASVDTGRFALVPITASRFNPNKAQVTITGPACPIDANFCAATPCMVNAVQLVEYDIAADAEVTGKTDLERRVIHAVNNRPIADETLVLAEYVVDLQLWGTYDTAVAGGAPSIPNDPKPTDDIGNQGGADEALLFNSRPNKIRALNVVLARRTSREDAEMRVAPGLRDAPADRIAADRTWFEVAAGVDGYARVATLQAEVEAPNLYRGL